MIIFSEVCRQLRHWHDSNLLPLGFKRIVINISPVQFERHDVIKKIQQCIRETCVPVQHLEIELTESFS
ncbi:MAG: EAL domain-containing protein [Methylomarinum sp.]|nr:EAL domain-containing protein [Methylomarinum sp.]